jgi:WD40 repeat protein
LNDANLIIPVVDPRGKRLALVSGHWPAQDRSGKVDIFELPSLALLGSVDLPRGWSIGKESAFSPDSKYLAVCCGQYVTIIDVINRRRVKGGELGPFVNDIGDVDFSPFEQILAFTSRDKIHLHDSRTFQPICDPIKTAMSFGICFSPDGRLFATCGFGSVKLWKTSQPSKPVRAFRQIPGQMFRVTFSPNGRRILTSGHDGKLRLWHPDTGEELLVLNMEEGVFLGNGSFSADGNSIIASTGGYARVFRAGTDTNLDLNVQPLVPLGHQ